MTRRITRDIALAALVILASPPPAGPQAVGTSTLSIGASFDPRASLRTATSSLQFDVAEDGRVEDAVVRYRVAARTRRDGGVALTLAVDETSDAARRAAAGLAVRCRAMGEPQTLVMGRPQEMARWRGSGVREGVIRCALDGAGAAGRYTLPVRLAVVLD